MFSRTNFAILVVTLMTLVPLGVQVSLRNQKLVDFPSLANQLNTLNLIPQGWKLEESSYIFDDDWKQRLKLKEHFSARMTSPEGDRLNVLLMLSEVGEQLYHTPDICYAVHGCQVDGEPQLIEMPDKELGSFRAIEVDFPAIGELASGVVAYTYWVNAAWVSPPPRGILNRMGREPFLLKLQVVLEDEEITSPTARDRLFNYLEFLGKQLREINPQRIAVDA